MLSFYLKVFDHLAWNFQYFGGIQQVYTLIFLGSGFWKFWTFTHKLLHGPWWKNNFSCTFQGKLVKCLIWYQEGPGVEASPEPLCSCSMITILIFSLVSSGSTRKMSQHSWNIVNLDIKHSKQLLDPGRNYKLAWTIKMPPKIGIRWSFQILPYFKKQIRLDISCESSAGIHDMEFQDLFSPKNKSFYINCRLLQSLLALWALDIRHTI